VRRFHLRLVVAVVVLAALVVAALVVLPDIVRALAVRQITETTGRDAAIGDVDLNLFTRRITARAVRVADRAGGPPLVEIERLYARFRLGALIRGRIHLDDVAVDAPVVRLARDRNGDLNIEDIITRLLARPRREPARFRIDRLALERGRFVFQDQEATPPFTWDASALAIDARDVGTEVADGRARLAFQVGGAPVRLEADDIALRPIAAHLAVTVDGADVRPLARYVRTDAPVLLAGGRFTTRMQGHYGERDGLRLSGNSQITDLRLRRQGQDEPFVVAPAVTITSRDLAWIRGRLSASRMELTGEPTIVDETVTPPEHHPTNLRVVLEGAAVPGDAPARVHAALTVRGNGVLEAKGTAVLQPLSTDLEVTLARIDLALAKPYLPADAALTIARGVLSGAVHVRYDQGAALLDGDVDVADVEIRRRGQREPFAHDTRVRSTLAGVKVEHGTLTDGTITVTASPTIVDASVTPAQRFVLRSFTARADRVTWPATVDARVSIEAALDGGGKASLRGRINPGSLDGRGRATITDVDLERLNGYLPADPPITLSSGRLTMTGRLTHTRATGLQVDGTGALADLVLLRPGQAEPFVADRSLGVVVRGLTVDGSALSAGRVIVSGTPRVIEASGHTPQRVEFASLAVAVDDLAWPPRGVARVDATATLTDGAFSTLQGSLDLKTLAATAQATFAGYDLARINTYVPRDAAVSVAGGRVAASVGLTHDRATGVVLTGDGTIERLVLARADTRQPFLTDRRLQFSFADLTFKDGVTFARRIAAKGVPAVVDETASPPRRVFTRTAIAAEAVTWPGDDPTPVTARVEIPDGGALDLAGTVRLRSRALALNATLDGFPLAPFASHLPVSTNVAGRLDGSLAITGSLGAETALEGRGTVTARDVAIGPRLRPRITVAGIAATGLDVRWPLDIRVQTITLRQPAILIERAEDGSFPLRTMLTPEEKPDREATTPAWNGKVDRGRPPVYLGRLEIRDGEFRFVDRTSRPFYSEEATRVTATLTGLSTRPEEPAKLTVQGVVGQDAALDLAGAISPFGDPFFLDVSGELRDFSVARTNPYLNRLLSWIAVDGELSTRLHYRIVGNELTGTNEVVVERLHVTPDRTSDRSVGIPLGLVTSLLKDGRGRIALTVPVEGELGSPQFTVRNAVTTALRNIISRVATGPFRAVGSLFTGSGDTEDNARVELRVEPVVFPPGRGLVTPEGSQHVQRVADALRVSPHVKLALRPVVTQDDANTAQIQEVTVRIQRLQREENLRSFTRAARVLFRRERPAEPVPRTPEEIVTSLAKASGPVEDALARLVERRVRSTQRVLVEGAGLDPARIIVRDGPPRPVADGEGRIEFELLP
jgi:uncharacterized protein involved in outer membrane biogenesis